MDENKQNDNMNGSPVSEEEYHKEPKINYIIYTIISILLFAVLLQFVLVEFDKHLDSLVAHLEQYNFFHHPN